MSDKKYIDILVNGWSEGVFKEFPEEFFVEDVAKQKAMKALEENGVETIGEAFQVMFKEVHLSELNFSWVEDYMAMELDAGNISSEDVEKMKLMFKEEYVKFLTERQAREEEEYIRNSPARIALKMGESMGILQKIINEEMKDGMPLSHYKGDVEKIINDIMKLHLKMHNEGA